MRVHCTPESWQRETGARLGRSDRGELQGYLSAKLPPSDFVDDGEAAELAAYASAIALGSDARQHELDSLFGVELYRFVEVNAVKWHGVFSAVGGGVMQLPAHETVVHETVH